MDDGSNLFFGDDDWCDWESDDCEEEADSVGERGETFLDPNHTNFILVDDGTNNQFEAAMEFRANLEWEIARKINGENVLLEDTF